MREIEEIDLNGYNYYKYPLEIRMAYLKNHFFKGKGRFRSIKFESEGDFSIIGDCALRELAHEIFKGKYYNPDCNPICLVNKMEYFREYHQGFLNGCNDLLNVVKSKLGPFDDLNSTINKIFDYVRPTLNKQEGPSITMLMEHEDKLFLEKGSVFEFGQKLGREYKAWYFIFENHQNFVNLFRTDDEAVNFYKNCLKAGVFDDPKTVAYFTKLVESCCGGVSATNTIRFTKPQIALICFYNNTLITRENDLDIAKQFGHDKAGRLYQEYGFYQSNTNRLAIEENSKTKSRNKIELFESVINQLDGLPKKKALDELNLLKSKISNMF